jgi:sRNA-binding protein
MPLESAPVNGAGKLCFKKPDATHKALAGLFPRAFTSELYLPYRPLKCSIHLDLVATGIVTTSAEAHCILGPDCRRRMYLLAFVEGETRVDLDGNPSGTVSAAEVPAATLACRYLETRHRGD